MNFTPDDREFMARAIALTERGRDTATPNPSVGCVIVKGGRVIGEGWHERAGEPHAEIHALKTCSESPEGATVYAAMNALILTNRQVFIVDTHINLNPTAAQLAEITLRAAEVVRRFGLVPKVALLSHSNFGTHSDESALKMREALALLRERDPDLEVDGEMHGDCALDEAIRKQILPDSTLTGSANLLVMPNLDAANICYNVLKTAAGNNVAVGPILLGAGAPVHILTPSTTVRRIVNMTALTVTEANAGDRVGS